jgi:hypothetical protein
MSYTILRLHRAKRKGTPTPTLPQGREAVEPTDEFVGDFISGVKLRYLLGSLPVSNIATYL